jgi:hypothetical protein
MLFSLARMLAAIDRRGHLVPLRIVIGRAAFRISGQSWRLVIPAGSPKPDDT